jgi:hypothetical protein
MFLPDKSNNLLFRLTEPETIIVYITGGKMIGVNAVTTITTWRR